MTVIWNRDEKRDEVEKVYGDASLKWAYESKSGRKLVDQIFSRPVVSKLYGTFQSSRLSRRKIENFIHDFKINTGEFEMDDFGSFNDFFIRKFKPGARSFVQTPDIMPAFCEGRYLAYSRVWPELKFPVKGSFLTAEAIIGDAKKAEPFRDGPLLIVRLCPTDYHRFHFPDDGRMIERFPVAGRLHSVNPLALKYRGDIFATNERQVSILETKNFGKLAYVEVGALAVGRIVETHQSEIFKRGDEKGYFLFGGSTVILFGEPGRWSPDQDLIIKTGERRESLVKLGQGIAQA